MFFIAYTFKGQVHVFARQVKIVSHSSCRTSTILKYFFPLLMPISTINRGSYINADVLLNLLNSFGEKR